MIEPFAPNWLRRFDEEELERLAIMTVDGCLSDREAEQALFYIRKQKAKRRREIWHGRNN